jgi:hypothetical protein
MVGKHLRGRALMVPTAWVLVVWGVLTGGWWGEC